MNGSSVMCDTPQCEHARTPHGDSRGVFAIDRADVYKMTMASKKRINECHRVAVQEANKMIRKIKMDGDEKQLAAGTGLKVWKRLALDLAKMKVERVAIGAALAWALAYNEAYWKETDKG